MNNVNYLIPSAAEIEELIAQSKNPDRPFSPQREIPQEKTVPYKASLIELGLIIALFIFGYIFVQWTVELNWYGSKVAVYGIAYISLIFGICYFKKVKPLKESFYWLAIMLLTLLSYVVWEFHAMLVWQFLLLWSVTIYWSITMFQGLLSGKTENTIILDIVNIFFIVPAQNTKLIFLTIKQMIKPKNGGKQKVANKNAIAIIIGVICTVPLLMIILPLLIQADATNVFQQLLEKPSQWVEQLFRELNISEFIFYSGFAAVLTIYYGNMLLGFLAKRKTTILDVEGAKEQIDELRFIPTGTILTILTIISLFYILFIGIQFPYLFSAFIGKLPTSVALYSDYARSGFFELCRIASLNIAIIMVINVFAKVRRVENKALVYINIMLSIITMLLILTAFSKMALYINMYGFTIRRIQVCSFLVFLFAVWLSFIVLQYRKFSIVKSSLMIGTAIVCLLCISNIDLWAENYNIAHQHDSIFERFDEYGESIDNF